jgi:hypothetical protein
MRVLVADLERRIGRPATEALAASSALTPSLASLPPLFVLNSEPFKDLRRVLFGSEAEVAAPEGKPFHARTGRDLPGYA